MITLPNGDKWIYDEEEYKSRGISYEEACKGNIPQTTIKSFVEKIYKAHNRDDNSTLPFYVPRKLIKEFDKGHWDCNFDVFKEVFGSVAISVLSNPWSTVYKMSWNDYVVVFVQADCGGYDCETALKVYNCYSNYLLDVTLNQ